MVNLYGKAPYQVAVIHGGPGDIGSLAHFAEKLSKRVGIAEPLQSKYSIAGLLEELHQQLSEYCTFPVTLIGHSWGGWLSTLYAEQYPKEIRTLVLVGCPPFNDDYVHVIQERRMQKLSFKEQTEFSRLLQSLAHEGVDRQAVMTRLQSLVERTDHYAVIEEKNPRAFVDGDMYAKIWMEAAALRKRGVLADGLSHLTCPVYILQGEDDPHLVEGVVQPLETHGVHTTVYLLNQCGHRPFEEKYAKDFFYETLFKIIDGF